MTREEYLSLLNDEECHCECHDSNMGIMHFMPCCNPCAFCKKNIKNNVLRHLERCKKD